MMITDGPALHDRASRGEPLSEAEQQLLQAWYTAQDQDEDRVINPAAPRETTSAIHQQIAQTVAQLEAITQQIAGAVAANDAIRREIAVLQARLTRHTPGRAA